MSTEKGSNGANSDCPDQVCRDFLRNECQRGKGCKYLHPNESEQDSNSNGLGGNGKGGYIFCRDYQNNQCTRRNCRFIHCSRKKEQYFKMTGELPEHVLPDSIRKGITVDPSNPSNEPVCKDYLKGSCRRAGNCKFRHLTLREYEIELEFHIGSLPPGEGSTTTATDAPRRRSYEDCEYDYYGENNSSGVGYDGEVGPPDVKRRHTFGLDPYTSNICYGEEHEFTSGQNYPAQTAVTGAASYHSEAPTSLDEYGTTAELAPTDYDERMDQAGSENYPASYYYEPYSQYNCCYNTPRYNDQYWSPSHDESTYYSPESSSNSAANEQYWQRNQHANREYW